MPEVSKNLASSEQKRLQGGFSLIEVVAVVTVILIIAAIAVPRMLQARMKANEASAVASMRVIQTAEVMYNNAYPDIGYSNNLMNLGTHGTTCELPTNTNACLIMDDALTSGLKSGYTFELIGDGNVPDRAYTLTASPESSGTSGRCGFISNETGEFLLSSGTGTGRASANTSVGTCDPS